jgi:DNA-cytosine methyltransferase
MLRHVDLCSGIGGFSLGFEWAGLSKPVLFCDIEPWSRKILNKHWPDVPIAEDVKELANDPEGLVPECDIITAGYPCQPFSVAGSQKGEADPRHIWPYIFRIIAQRRPTWVVCENVYGHVRLGLDKVLTDLETEGYTSRTFIVPACGINAPHKRDRLWIVGYTKHNGSPTSEIGGVSDKTGEHDSQGQNQTSEFKGTSRPRSSEDVAYTQSKRHRGGIPKGIELKNGSFSRKNQKGERWGVKLKDAVSHSEKMWPTPTTQEIEHNNMTLTQNGRRLSQNGKSSHSLNLADTVKMWPTPTTRDHKGGYQGGRVRNGKISNDTLDVAVQYTDNQSKTGGQLNPIFVEWLMGYPIGWTELKD